MLANAWMARRGGLALPRTLPHNWRTGMKTIGDVA